MHAPALDDFVMSVFWIVGIIVNVALTAALIYWVFTQMRSKGNAPETPDTAPNGSASGGDQGTETERAPNR